MLQRRSHREDQIHAVVDVFSPRYSAGSPRAKVSSSFSNERFARSRREDQEIHRILDDGVRWIYAWCRGEWGFSFRFMCILWWVIESALLL